MNFMQMDTDKSLCPFGMIEFKMAPNPYKDNNSFRWMGRIHSLGISQNGKLRRGRLHLRWLQSNPSPASNNHKPESAIVNLAPSG